MFDWFGILPLKWVLFSGNILSKFAGIKFTGKFCCLCSQICKLRVHFDECIFEANPLLVNLQAILVNAFCQSAIWSAWLWRFWKIKIMMCLVYLVCRFPRPGGRWCLGGRGETTWPPTLRPVQLPPWPPARIFCWQLTQLTIGPDPSGWENCRLILDSSRMHGLK